MRLRLSFITMLGVLAIVSLLVTTTASGQSLCPGSGVSPERNGILAPLQQVSRLIPVGDSGARLLSVDLEAQEVCQYQVLSPKHQRLIFISAGMVPLRFSTRVAASPNDLSLPDGLVDLPNAIAGAQAQGMLLPLESARLDMAQPRGKLAVAVWTLCPKRDPQGRVLCYFVSATDPDHPLKLSDITDYVADYNAQRRVVDLFHPAPSTRPSPQPTPLPKMDGAPCLWFPGTTVAKKFWRERFGNPYDLECKY
jgi:hypothetical protein